MKKILIIEDEQAISMALEDDFRLEGYDVTVASDGKTGLQLALRESADIILLDIMLPEMNGMEVFRTLRSHGVHTPVIMLTAKNEEIDRVVGLEIGADDYVTKPFSPRELQARVKAVLRRTLPTQVSTLTEQFGDVRVDFDGYRVTKKGEEVRFTALEFALLRFLVENRNRVLSRDQILDAVWHENVVVEPRTVDTHIANLRRKLEDDPAHPTWIIGVRGIGYKFMIY